MQKLEFDKIKLRDVKNFLKTQGFDWAGTIEGFVIKYAKLEDFIITAEDWQSDDKNYVLRYKTKVGPKSIRISETEFYSVRWNDLTQKNEIVKDYSDEWKKYLIHTYENEYIDFLLEKAYQEFDELVKEFQNESARSKDKI